MKTHDLSESGRSRTGELPPSAELHDVLRSAGEPGQHPVRRAVAALVTGHRDQWLVEDRCRDVPDDASLAALKRSIDAMNQQRVQVIDTVDGWAEQKLAGHPDAPLHTETLGQLVDRMAVAAVRREQLGRAAQAGRRGVADAERAERQLDDLCSAYDVLVRAWLGEVAALEESLKHLRQRRAEAETQLSAGVQLG